MLSPPNVSDVMNEPVTTVTPETTVLEATRLLHENDIGSVVVVDEEAVVGIVTESDVVALVAADGDPAETRVESVMAQPVETVSQDTTVVEAARRFRDRRIKKLPVCEDGQLVGILTTTDIANYLPHARHSLPSYEADADRVRQTERQDTAYERDDWAFEYLGHEASIDVGDTLRFSKTLDQSEVEAFADASGDTNRLHLDDAYAAGTRFGRRIVHGTLVAGTISAALARLPGLIIYLSQELSYLGPVDIGERVTAECEVVEDIGDDRYRLTTTVEDSDGDAVIDGEAVVLADPIPETA
jgi:CBS domain-containing protein/acyl dehydratase